MGGKNEALLGYVPGPLPRFGHDGPLSFRSPCLATFYRVSVFPKALCEIFLSCPQPVFVTTDWLVGTLAHTTVPFLLHKSLHFCTVYACARACVCVLGLCVHVCVNPVCALVSQVCLCILRKALDHSDLSWAKKGESKGWKCLVFSSPALGCVKYCGELATD